MTDQQAQLFVSAYMETTSDEEWESYAAAVAFMAFWFEKQDGADGKDTNALFEEFKENVCIVMKGDAVKGD